MVRLMVPPSVYSVMAASSVTSVPGKLTPGADDGRIHHAPVISAVVAVVITSMTTTQTVPPCWQKNTKVDNNRFFFGSVKLSK